MQKSVDQINQSVLTFAKLPNKTKSPEMKNILSDITSQQKEISKYKDLLQRKVAPILTDLTSQYVHSRIIHSNVIPSSMEGCVVTRENTNNNPRSVATQISKHEQESFRLQNIPLPAN